MNVSLGNIRSIKVTVTGEVIAPGTYTLSSLSSVQNALYACGGPNDVGTYRKINVIRNNRIVTTFDIYELLMNWFCQKQYHFTRPRYYSSITIYFKNCCKRQYQKRRIIRASGRRKT
ncbi:MAG: SLBB domain-containing protein [Emticicia sp.]|nr:SLBB domain-containing protein [Emticicia sp.]